MCVCVLILSSIFVFLPNPTLNMNIFHSRYDPLDGESAITETSTVKIQHNKMWMNFYAMNGNRTWDPSVRSAKPLRL